MADDACAAATARPGGRRWADGSTGCTAPSGAASPTQYAPSADCVTPNSFAGLPTVSKNVGLTASKRSVSSCSMPRATLTSSTSHAAGQAFAARRRSALRLSSVATLTTRRPPGRSACQAASSSRATSRPLPPTKMASGPAGRRTPPGAVPWTALQVADAERLGVGQDQVIVGRVLLDGVDHARLAQLGRLDGHRAGAGADVPDDAAGLDVQLRQGDGPHLGLGDQAALGPALGEHVVGIAEAARSGRRAPGGRAGPACASGSCTLSGANSISCDVGQLALRDALVGAAEVLADVGPEVVEAAGQQLPGDPRRVPPSRW